MVAISGITYHEIPFPGVKFGVATTAQDGYTSAFGFATLLGGIVMSADDDDAIATLDVSAGSGTLGLVDDAGAAVSSDTKIFFIVWGKG